MWLQMIVDPPGENRGFHRCRPRRRQCFHPAVQIEAGGGNRSFAVNRATAILYAVADRPLVHIQSNVIHRFHGGASLVFLNQRPLSSAFLHQTLLLRPIHSNLSGTNSRQKAAATAFLPARLARVWLPNSVASATILATAATR